MRFGVALQVGHLDAVSVEVRVVRRAAEVGHHAAAATVAGVFHVHLDKPVRRTHNHWTDPTGDSATVRTLAASTSTDEPRSECVSGYVILYSVDRYQTALYASSRRTER